MMRRRDLVRALGEYELADWTVVEHDQQIGIADTAQGVQRAEHRVTWLLTVHHDTPAGRGSAHVALDAASGDAEAVVREAVTLARASVGPAWVTQPPAAPARVELEDETLAAREPVAIAAELVRTPAGANGATLQTTARVVREKVALVSRQGLHTQWTATQLRTDLTVTRGGHTLRVTREARRLADLGLSDAIAAASKDLELLGQATPLAPGPAAIVLGPDALLPGGLGVWAVFAPQADAVVERQGLTRYREHSPRAEGAYHDPEPLTIVSDGALPYGLYSAPMGDQGDAVRRFTLIDRGIATGLSLAPREAALRGRDPNGGVRNLAVELGSWSGRLDATNGRLLEVKRLRGLSFDPYTGDAALEILLAIDHDTKGSHPVSGGSLRIDMIAALARGRRSSERLTRGGYVGPASVLVDAVELTS
jgi:hypothetical protein